VNLEQIAGIIGIFKPPKPYPSKQGIAGILPIYNDERTVSVNVQMLIAGPCARYHVPIRIEPPQIPISIVSTQTGFGIVSRRPFDPVPWDNLQTIPNTFLLNE
jgi:hypothetical protein